MSDGAAMAAFLASRRSVRQFAPAPIDRAVLERVLTAATTAPSSTNRQPWRFTVVTAALARDAIARAVRRRTEALDAVIAGGAHAAEWRGYGDFFWQPLAGAAAIVVPATRVHADAIAGFLRSAGADPASFTLPSAMQPELCALAGAVMCLLLQAHAEGLGAVWMAGPTVAQMEIEAICELAPPWRMVGAIALGHPAGPLPPAPPRRAAEQVIRWIEDEGQP